MSIGRSSNPVMQDKYFNEAVSDGSVMTINGAMVKTCILLLFVLFGASFGWKHGIGLIASTFQDKVALQASLDSIASWTMVSSIIALVLAFITCMAPKLSMFTSIGYSIAEGVALGSISLCYAFQFKGIIATALFATVGITVAMFVLYKLEIVKVTEKFKSVVVLSTLGIFFALLAQFVCKFFFGSTVLAEGPIAIVVCVVCLVVASLNLLLDFDLIERGAEARAPKYMEWYSAFGLVVTLVWVYVEMLRLLSYLNKKN